MTEPTTPTGRQFYPLPIAADGQPFIRVASLDDILAIEREAREQERERLRPLVMALRPLLRPGYGKEPAWAALYDALEP